MYAGGITKHKMGMFGIIIRDVASLMVCVRCDTQVEACTLVMRALQSLLDFMYAGCITKHKMGMLVID
jgi:hypothetical protein